MGNETKTDRILSGCATALCALYVLWAAWRLGAAVPAMRSLFDGLGAELPASTRFVLGIPPAGFLAIAAAVVLPLIAKEVVPMRTTVRLLWTLVAFVIASWFFDFATDAFLRPLLRLTEAVG